MDVDTPGLSPRPSTSTAAAPRKRTGHPSDADSEDTLIYSTASDESSDEVDFVPVTRRKAKRRLLMASPSSSKTTTKTREPPVHTILFMPVAAADSLNRLNRQATSRSLEAIAPGQIVDVRINSRKNVLAIDVTQRNTLDVLSNVKVLEDINVRSYIPDGRDSTAGVIYDVDISISESDFPVLIKPVTEGLIILQARRLGNSRCVKLVFKGDSLPSHVKVGHFRHAVRPFVPRPLQCRNCLKMGHVSAVCTNPAVCSRCSESHSTDACHAEHRKCGNCHGPHDASSKDCPNMKKEMQVLRQMVRDGSTRREAAAKVRRRRSRRRRPSQPAAEAGNAPLQMTVHTPPQASSNTGNEQSKKDASIIGPPDAWPALPTVDPPTEPQRRSSKITSERQCGDSRDKEIVAMVKALMNTIRALLNSINTPAAKRALQILDALNPVLSSLEKHHGSSSASLP
ncbi:uncharacterized protein LOC119391178 [Rhipicephalus sanguineus]|uniref:uncharacterized protein LOC119391178 n=1 Tax=Rhipicephalus sanguineus TaxID=34632 RepID=UPI0018954669|nr:uncharacterized protein LOC119391178 [Rhipicephalus sanguineus]